MSFNAKTQEIILTDELKEQLRTCGLDHYLSFEEFSEIIAYNKIIRFEQDEILIKQGENPNGIFMIISGKVNLTAKILGEGEANIEILGPGCFIGVISYIENLSNDTSIIAEEKTTCLFINRNYFEIIRESFPEIKYKLYSAIVNQVCRRLKNMHDKITALMTQADMVPRSMYGEFIYSFTKPEKISFENIKIERKRLDNSLSPYFNHDELSELLHHATFLKVAKKCTLIHAGSKNTSCYIVLQGAIQSSFAHQNKNAKLSVIGPTTLFASVNAIEPEATFTITFSARENAILLMLSHEDLNYFKNEHKKVWYKLYNLICRSIIVLEKSINKLDIRLKIEEYNR